MNNSGSSSQPRVSRTTSWVDREYGREKWPLVEETVSEMLGKGETSLARLIARAARVGGGHGWSSLEPSEVVVGQSAVRTPLPVATGGHLQLLIEAVLDECRPDTDLLVELAAGWGRNLFSIWLSGGPREAQYVAAEFTDAGCRAARLLASVNSEMRFRASKFDLKAPRLNDRISARHAVVLTSHGIEQVPELGDELVDFALSLAPEISAVHLEPVGWQRGQEAHASRAPMEYAIANDYNRNLVALLDARETSGSIKIIRFLTDVVGVNPANPSSLIVWRSTAGSGR